jgi:hypothetical protein
MVTSGRTTLSTTKAGSKRELFFEVFVNFFAGLTSSSHVLSTQMGRMGPGNAHAEVQRREHRTSKGTAGCTEGRAAEITGSGS